MEQKLKDRLIEICNQVGDDTKKDAIEFDGKPFDGRTVATYFGYHGAAIKALSDVIKEVLKHQPLPAPPQTEENKTEV